MKLRQNKKKIFSLGFKKNKMGNSCSCNKVPTITVSTLGDSLTQSGYPFQRMDCGCNKPTNWYQYYMYNYLLVRNVESSILNLGIGGQTISQICDRILSAVPSTYITIMAGTNDVLTADYTDPSVNENLAKHVIDTYALRIPQVIAKQVSEGFPAPIIIICTIPPVGPSITLGNGTLAQKTDAIEFVNNAIRDYVKNTISSSVILCDTNRYLKGQNNLFLPGLYLTDNLHFSMNGFIVCGEAIAQTIIEHYYSW